MDILKSHIHEVKYNICVSAYLPLMKGSTRRRSIVRGAMEAEAPVRRHARERHLLGSSMIDLARLLVIHMNSVTPKW